MLREVKSKTLSFYEVKRRQVEMRNLQPLAYISTRGFSLIELMISLALGSVLCAGMVQLFVASSETYTLIAGQSRMQESARFSLALMTWHARLAGYRGCFSGSEVPYMTINPATNLPYEFNLRLGIQGYDADSVGGWAPSLTELPHTKSDFALFNPLNKVFKTSYGYGSGNGIDLSKIVPGTDVVTFRHLSQVEARLAGYDIGGASVNAPMPTSAEPIVVRVDANWAEFDLDHIVMIHDCEKATMFRVTSSNPWGKNASGRPKGKPDAGELIIGHDMNDIDYTRNSLGRVALFNTFGLDAAVSSIETHIFFIAEGAGVNKDGDKPLSLWRKTGLKAPVELVEGVENLQVLYGVDADNDRVPNQYLSANMVSDWRKIITVRLSLVVNSIDSVGSNSAPSHGCDIQKCISPELQIDGLLRKSFSQTIYLRNHL